MEPSSNYGSASAPFWRGRVWIVCGGPSAKAFDFSRVGDDRVLSVNGHGLRSPRTSDAAPVAVFSLDNTWVRRNWALLASHEGEKFVALPLETWPDCAGIPGATYLKWSHQAGLSEDPTTIRCGCNSGYGALNLAYLKRADEIHFVGLDLDPKDDDAFVYWAPLFRDAVPQLKVRGVCVVNHNPDSFVDAFPKEI